MNKKKIASIIALSIILTLTSGNISPVFAGGPLQEEISGEGNGSDIGGILSTINNIQAKNVIISQVNVVGETVEPGKKFTVTFRVENISGAKIDGLSLKIVNLEGKGILEPFMPVGTTNEIYVGSIGKDDIRDVSITLNSSPTTKEGVYNFITSVMYSQWGGAQEEITKTIGILVKNPAVISLSELQYNSNVITGTVFNEGTSKVKNIRAIVKVGEESVEQTIGNIDVESEGYININVPSVKEQTKAEIEVKYEDTTGKEFSTKGSCMVEPKDETSSEKGPAKVKKSFWASIKAFFGFGN